MHMNFKVVCSIGFSCLLVGCATMPPNAVKYAQTVTIAVNPPASTQPKVATPTTENNPPVASSSTVLPAKEITGGPRFALVIGNGDYTHVTPLRNPVNDARDMARALQQLGFQVTLLTDATRPQMDSAVVHLESKLAGSTASVGFFYYAGHGVQMNGTNYLVPVNADIPAAPFLSDRAEALQSVLDELGSAGNRLNVFVLDACRDNPFSWSRGGTRGLTVVGKQPAGSIIAFAAGAGQVAEDGTGSNGIYTGELLKHLDTPNTNFLDMLTETGGAVSADTGGSQNPAVYSQFYGKFYLKGQSTDH